jgi:carboxyvinyl-carboxyphosphonate phosphorylmutase
MNHSDRRKQLRAILGAPECISPASVYDAMSARIAELTGFRIGIFSGKIASGTTLASPDLNLITLTEFADQARRIMRASDLSLIVDADHGYGNALNVMRTVEELEYAGVSMLSIEDTVLPVRYGQPLGEAELIPLDEMADKVRAAVKARQDGGLMIAARTAALRHEGRERTLARVKAYARAGADAIFLLHVKTLDDIDAVHAASGLPIVVGLGPPSLTRTDMAARGARVLTQGHFPVAAAAKALQDAYEHFYRGGSPEEIKGKLASDEQMKKIVRGEHYDDLQRDYLRAGGK